MKRGKKMAEFEAKMKDSNGSNFPYVLEAEDIFEADERANKLAISNGWTYYDIAPK